MDHDNTALTQALATRQPPAIAAALRAGTVLIPTYRAPEGDDRPTVLADDEGRRVLHALSSRSMLLQWVEHVGQGDQYRVTLGIDLAEVAREQEVDKVLLDGASPQGMSVTPDDLQLALDQAGAVGAAPPDNPALVAALVRGDLGTVAKALSAGTVIVPARSAQEGGEIAQLMTPDGRRALYGFSTGDTFAAWVRMTGDDGDHRVLGGSGLGVLAQQLGVAGVVLDPLAPHAMSLDPQTLLFALAVQRDDAPAPERRGSRRRRQ